MPTVIWGALITLVGTAILAPLVSRLLAFYFEHRARLRVEVRLAAWRQPEFLKEEINKWLSQELAAEMDWTLRASRLRPFTVMESIDSFARMTFFNSSKRRIDGITLMVEDSRGVYQIGDSKETRTFERSTKIEIGSLQPRHRIKVTLWLASNVAESLYVDLNKLFLVSADELHGVYFKFIVAEHVRQKYSLIPRWVTRLWWALMFIAVFLGGEILKVMTELKSH
jgi:hypothetical protein